MSVAIDTSVSVGLLVCMCQTFSYALVLLYWTGELIRVSAQVTSTSKSFEPPLYKRWTFALLTFCKLIGTRKLANMSKLSFSRMFVITVSEHLVNDMVFDRNKSYQS